MNDQPTPGQVLHKMLHDADLWTMQTQADKERYEEAAEEFTSREFTAHILGPINEALDRAGAPSSITATIHPTNLVGKRLLDPAERIAALVERHRAEIEKATAESFQDGKGAQAIMELRARDRVIAEIKTLYAKGHLDLQNKLVTANTELSQMTAQRDDYKALAGKTGKLFMEAKAELASVHKGLDSAFGHKVDVDAIKDAHAEKFRSVHPPDRWAKEKAAEQSGTKIEQRHWSEDTNGQWSFWYPKEKSDPWLYDGTEYRIAHDDSPLATLAQDPIAGTSLGKMELDLATGELSVPDCESDIDPNSTAEDGERAFRAHLAKTQPKYRDLVPGVDVWQEGDEYEGFAGTWKAWRADEGVWGIKLNPFGSKGRRPIRPPVEEDRRRVEDEFTILRKRAERQDLAYAVKLARIEALQADLTTARNRIHVLEHPWKKASDGLPTEGDANEHGEVLWFHPEFSNILAWWNGVNPQFVAWMRIPAFTP